MSTDHASNASEHDGVIRYRTSVSRSSNHAIHTTFATSTQPQLTMDELTEATDNQQGQQGQEQLGNNMTRPTHRKNRLSTRIKQISTAITSAVDKLQLSTYSHTHSKTLDMLPNSTLDTPTGTTRAKSLTANSAAAAGVSDSFAMAAGDNIVGTLGSLNNKSGAAAAGSLQDSSTDNPFTASSHGFQWNAPLQWTRMFVLKAFDGTQQDIDQVYELYVLDRLSRGRQESLLSYEEGENNAADADDEYNAAIPNKQKKSVHDVMAIATTDSVEVCGDASPEGWILARFCDETARKGFVPVACLTLANAVAVAVAHANNETTSNAPSNMTLAMQQHLHATTTTMAASHAQQESGSMMMDEYMQSQLQNNKNGNILRASQSSTFPVTNTNNKGEDLSINIEQETEAATSNTAGTGNDNGSGGAHDRNSSTSMKSSNLPQQHLPIHWPFSSYPISKRSKKGKIMETVVIVTLLIIYALPILIEEPLPKGAPKNYNLWFINLFGAFLPWLIISVSRCCAS